MSVAYDTMFPITRTTRKVPGIRRETQRLCTWPHFHHGFPESTQDWEPITAHGKKSKGGWEELTSYMGWANDKSSNL